MGIRQNLLEALQHAGDNGMSPEELMAVAKVGHPNPVYSHIYRLRRAGKKIVLKNDRYYIRGGASIEKGNDVAVAKTIIKAAHNGCRSSSKVSKTLALLQNAAKEGVSCHDIAKETNSDSNNIGSLIHSLRGKNLKIVNKDGRYFLKSSVPEGMTPPEVVANGSPVDFTGMKSTEIMKIRLLDPADRDTYLDMCKKATFYSACAAALLNAVEHTNNIKKEVSCEV